MFYFVQTPFWLRKLYPKCLWRINPPEKSIYLTFDDGPHPHITSFVLDELKKWNAKATFFCIGKNVQAHPEIYKRILMEGHAVGNHTYNHLNGWKTPSDRYFSDIEEAGKLIDSKLFRPPYGRATMFQNSILTGSPYNFTAVMWTVLSGDFDIGISPEKCFDNVRRYTGNGSIVVFHDSEKAAERMKYALPRVLQNFSKLGFAFKKISL